MYMKKILYLYCFFIKQTHTLTSILVCIVCLKFDICYMYTKAGQFLWNSHKYFLHKYFFVLHFVLYFINISTYFRGSTLERALLFLTQFYKIIFSWKDVVFVYTLLLKQVMPIFSIFLKRFHVWRLY